ncbi:MAG: sulfatase-like hydrolase/transferase [Chloroflexi bacterium]|nr:sulfatase-like hydrolase/transferase [Chloroflexota bacterium]MBU1751367.1 sulfatase-like hydrolase/transferase [Chloroflexota bacterium]
MKWQPRLHKLVKTALAGLLLGALTGLAECLFLVIVDQPDGWQVRYLLIVVLAGGGLGLLCGVVLGAFGQPDLSVWRVRRAERPPAARWNILGRGLVQGLGAGVAAAVVLSLLEIVGLMAVDRSLEPWTGLLYALVAYGLLGLLGGLVLGLLWGLASWFVQWDEGEPIPWAILTTLLVLVGAFVVVRHRVRLDVTRVTWRTFECLLADAAGIAAGVALTVGLWLLLRWLRPRRLRWPVGLYLALLLAAVLISGTPQVSAALYRAGLPSGIPADLQDAPNVIFIVVDTLRADHLSCYTQCPVDAEHPVGWDTENHTPHMDALARDGVRYAQMSAQASWTKPSVATMLTSLYPSSHRVILNRDSLPDAVVTLPEVLQERGYRTAGLSTNIIITSRFNFQQGFYEFTFLEPSLSFLASPVSERFAAYSTFYLLREIVQGETLLSPDNVYQDAATLNEHALAWLEAHRDTRFFLYLHYMDPHVPYIDHPYDGAGVINIPRTPDNAPRVHQSYVSEVAYTDDHLGDLFDQLKAWGLYDDALIVFTADHGDEFYEHEGWMHGNTLYEELLAVPLIVKYPHNAHAGTTDEGFARSLDIAPTVLDVLGPQVPAPASMQGVSLRPGTAAPRAEAIFAEVDHNGNVLRAIHTEQRKLIIAGEGNPRGLPLAALFDLTTDPGEQHNLVAAEPETVQRLRAELHEFVAFAQANAVAGQSTELDAATRERLRQLGY